MLKFSEIDWSTVKIDKPRHNSPSCDAYAISGKTMGGRELTEEELFDLEGMDQFYTFAENYFHAEPEKWD
jgi:hypothetical protein